MLIGTDHIGDVLCRTGSLPDLARALPDCRWSFASGRPADQLLETNPFLDQVVRLGTEVDLLGGPALYRLLRAAPFDVVICYDPGRYWRYVTAAVAARIPNRVAYRHKGFGSLATFPVAIRFPSPYARNFRDLVSQVVDRPLAHEGRPLVYATPEDEAAADAFLARLGLDPALPLIACSMLTRQHLGAYPPGQFIEALRQVAQRTPVHVVFLGSADERAALERAATGCGFSHTIAAGGLRLRELYCFLKRCRAVFAMDSGIRHLANAASVPVVFVRNLYAHGVEAGSYCDTEHDVSNHPGNLTAPEMKRMVPTFDTGLAAGKLIEILG